MDSERIAHAYLDAKRAVISAGFAHEVDWQERIRFKDLTESSFLEEFAWVVFSSGFREATLRGKFADLKGSFLEFSAAALITRHMGTCRRNALRVIGHPGKVAAVFEACRVIQSKGFSSFREKLELGGIEFIDQLPYMGPATSFHLAKNIGLNVVKPDRHLVRIARALGCASPHTLCSMIRDAVGDTLAVIDIVIWRYATLYPRGPSAFEHISLMRE